MQTSGSTDYQIIRETMARHRLRGLQYRVPKANPAVRDRTSLINSLFADAGGRVRLVIDGRCQELIRDFEEVQYKAGSTVIDKERDPSRTHLSDALGYLAWQEFRSVGQAGERSEPLL
jgi:hypothetical protein